MSIANQGQKKTEGTQTTTQRAAAKDTQGAKEQARQTPSYSEELGHGLAGPARASEGVGAEIDVKTAVDLAMAYFTDLYGSPYADLALEEVEKVDRRGTNKWLVTLGYLPARRNAMAGSFFPAAGATRQYKLITVDAETGEAESMKVAKV